MHNKETFGEIIRKLRESKNLPIRKVAAELDIDPSTLSKIERGERSVNRDHIRILAQLFAVNERELLIDHLSDKVSYELLSEDCSTEVLQAAEQKIKYFRALSSKQEKLNF